VSLVFLIESFERKEGASMNRTIPEAAERLQVSTKTIQRYKKQGRFPNAYKKGKRVYIPDSDLEPFLEPGTEEQEGGTPAPGVETTETISESEPDVETTTGTPETDIRDTTSTALAVPHVKHHLYIDLKFLRYEYFRYYGETSLIFDGLHAIGKKLQRLLTRLRRSRGETQHEEEG
jgi:excisionase family DNA binding protein